MFYKKDPIPEKRAVIYGGSKQEVGQIQVIYIDNIMHKRSKDQVKDGKIPEATQGHANQGKSNRKNRKSDILLSLQSQ